MKKNGCLALLVALALLCALPVGCTPAGSGTSVGEVSGASGGSVDAKADDLMAGIAAGAPATRDVTAQETAALADFALRLFRASAQEGKNTLISPLSVLAALGMTANGAAGETRAQMEAAVGMSVADLNNALYRYRALSETDPLKMANAIWINEDSGFAPEQDFLQANADYYGAGAYRAPFDEGTRQAINAWVKERTDGRIPEMLDKITSDAALYLVNALAFQAKWREPFPKAGTKKDIFTREDGVRQEIDFLNTEDEDVYLENDKATGFVKPYVELGYQFVALLPKKGVSVADLVASLDGAALQALLDGKKEVSVSVAMPKFQSEFSTEMSKALASLGMTDAFSSDKADFSAMGNVAKGDLFISRVLHKTRIEMNESGTKAAAATIVEIEDRSALAGERKTVRLDRPFVYLILHEGVPVFIGTLMDVR